MLDIRTLRCWVTSPLVPVVAVVTAFLLGMSLIVAATGGRAFVPALVIVLARDQPVADCCASAASGSPAAGWCPVMDSRSAAMVERHTKTQPHLAVPQMGCRTLCQHPGCGMPIEELIGAPGRWAHVGGRMGGSAHEANPVEQPEPSAGQQFLAGVQATERAYRRGRDEALPRQALEQPSSLVDSLLEAAGRHEVATVQSPGTYRAAERVAGLLLDILRADGGVR